MLQPLLDNHILRTLPPETLRHWLQHGEVHALRAGETLSTPQDKSRWSYFPLTAILVWVHLLESGATTAIAMVGREGASGLYNMLGYSNHLMVQCDGTALRMPNDLVKDAWRQSPAAHAQYTCFLRALMTQVSLTAACNRHHNLEQQLVRLLLLTLDRTDGTTVRMTHGQMAGLLGTRREGVSYAASFLQQRGLIEYGHGRISIHDRQALQAQACGCYRQVSAAYRTPPAIGQAQT